MTSDVAIIDVERTKFTEDWKKDQFDLAFEVGKPLLDRTGYHRAGVDGFYLAGNLSSYEAAKFRQMLGVKDKEVHFFMGGVESGVLALNYGIRSIKSGDCDVVFVGSSGRSLNTGTEHDYEDPIMKRRQGWYVEAGKIKMQMMNSLDITEESLAGIPVKAHFQGSLNPKAQYQKIFNREKILKSPYDKNAKPLREFEKSHENCCGAVGMVLASEDEARKHNNPIFVEGFGTAQCRDKEHCYVIPSIQIAVEKACKNVVKPSEVPLLQVSDSATPMEAVTLSNLIIPENELEEVLRKTFRNADEPKKQNSSWPYELDKPVFVNTGGGDKADGFPDSATSYIRRVIETRNQLVGNAGKRQVQDLNHGLTISIDGYIEMAVSSHLFGVR